MANLASVLKTEIRRLARKEIREQMGSTKKATAQYRREIAALKRQVDEQSRQIAFLEAQEKKRLAQEPSEELATNVRFSPSGLKSHRERLGFSAADYAKLVGVSPKTIYLWEQGEVRPRPKQLAGLVEVRGIGKREALKRLEMLNN